MKFAPLLFLTLLSLAQATEVSRAGLLGQLASTPEVNLSRQKLALAQAQVKQDEAWQISLSGDAGLNGVRQVDNWRNDWNVLGTLSVTHKGGAAFDDAHLTRLLALRRAEWAVHRITLAEVRRRVGAWNTLQQAAQALNLAELSQQAAQLSLRTTQARAAQGTANPMQVETAQLALGRAELGVRQATQGLAQARADLNLPSTDPAGAQAVTWLPLPLPPTGLLGPREDLLEAELSVTEARLVLQREKQSAQPNLQVVAGLTQGPLSLSADLDRQMKAGLSATLRLKPAESATWTLGVKGNLRLDGAAQRVVERANQTLSQALLTAQSAQQKAERDRQTKQATLLSAQQNIDLARQQLSASQQSAQVAAERLKLGLISEADALAAALEAARALDSLYSAQRTLDTATLDVWEAFGWLPSGLL